MPRWSVFGNQPAQQRLGGPDDQLAVVGHDDVVAALVLGPVACGNRVTLPGAFALTGPRPNRICVHVAREATPACVTVVPE